MLSIGLILLSKNEKDRGAHLESQRKGHTVSSLVCLHAEFKESLSYTVGPFIKQLISKT